ncbi:MAG: hypothetical protein BWX70_03459 [Verrucomicrobia bacterium ADurb.Bin070]|nr:MAG: hypothetical protein BWX70_03459 [Verrucomicrobia bacterium ADurb.Bin070]
MRLAERVGRGDRGARAGCAARNRRDHLRDSGRLGDFAAEDVFKRGLIVGILRRFAVQKVDDVNAVQHAVGAKRCEQAVDRDRDVTAGRPEVEIRAEISVEGAHARNLEVDEGGRERQVTQAFAIGRRVRHAVRFEVVAIVEARDVGDPERLEGFARVVRGEPCAETAAAGVAETDAGVTHPARVHLPIVHVERVHPGFDETFGIFEKELAESRMIAASGEGSGAERHHPMRRDFVAVEILVTARRIARIGAVGGGLALSLQAVERALVKEARALCLPHEAGLGAVDPEEVRGVKGLRRLKRVGAPLPARGKWNSRSRQAEAPAGRGLSVA